KKGLQAIIANSGCANACVKDGLKDARKMSELAARALNVNPTNVGVASKGIIGRRIDIEKIGILVEKASKMLSKNPKESLNAAKAIMTTDTRPKQVSVEFKGIEVGGMCKGAGMIAPDMATMLCFITTNANLTREQLQKALERSVDRSFNMTLVDGDMSTHDTVLLLSSGRKKCDARTFQRLLDYVTIKLAKMIAQDGEGASKYLEIEIVGARDGISAAKAARAIASSPLVKTAFYGETPNWGRIISRIGSSIRIKPMNTTITFKSRRGRVNVFDRGALGNLEKARDVLKEKEIEITINLRLGRASAKAFTCDLTEEYVRVNAGYN
ncbi:MAG: bifunctional glutamate N-acetyltransferase/amino-acid acetyltransferase ArgJ, partial [Candidatus Altiarchaeota archaeon]